MKLEDISSYCLSLPFVTSGIKWENVLVFSICQKMFLLIGQDKQAKPMVSFKCSHSLFLELTEIPGIIPAPYLARCQWVAVQNLDLFEDSYFCELIKNAYGLIYSGLPKKTKMKLNVNIDLFTF